MVDLNSLIPADSDLHLFNACSINSRREIIGLAFDAQGNFHGFLATPSNSAADSSAEVSAAIRSSFRVRVEAPSPAHGLGLHATIEHALNRIIRRRSWQSLLFHNRRLSRMAAVGLGETTR
jgi:hypothetical protein